MSSNSENLIKVTPRTPGGKKVARKLRHEGLIPGIIYGASTAPVSVSVDEKDLTRICYSSSFFSHIINVTIDKNQERILPREIDFDPVTERPIHVDFQRVSSNSKVRVHIPIEFIDSEKSPGMKKGGVLNTVIHQLECICNADSIPDKIEISLAGKDIGAGFGLDDIVLPKGATPAHAERDSVIATIVGSRTTVEDDKEQQPSENAAA